MELRRVMFRSGEIPQAVRLLVRLTRGERSGTYQLPNVIDRRRGFISPAEGVTG